MSTLPEPGRRINGGRAPAVSAGSEHLDAGEPIPARPARLLTPAEAESHADAIAREHSAASMYGGESPYPFKAGVYQTLYRELYEQFTDAQATIERMRPNHYPFGPDDELPDLAAEFVLARGD